MTDLNSLLPAGWNLQAATAINDSGQIVVNGLVADGSSSYQQAFLMTLSQQLIGVDVSAVPSLSDWSTVVAQVGPSALIADAFGGQSFYPDAQGILDSAPTGISQKAAYFELCFSRSACLTPAGQFNVAIQQLGNDASSVKVMGIALEPGNYPTDFASVSQRNEWIAAAVNAVALAGLQPVIYTRRDYWANITEGLNIPNVPTATGGISSYGCLPLWDSWNDAIEDLFNDGPLVGAGPIDPWTPFGGWSSRKGKQYAADVSQFGGTSLGTAFDLDVFSPALFSAGTPGIAMDESTVNNVVVLKGGFRLNHATNQFVQTVTITNTSAGNIPGPVSLALDNLSTNATLVGANGSTSCTIPAGSSFFNVQQGPLASGQSVTATLQFSNPSNQGISYSPRVLAGSGTR
jgi:hypothetical protein